MSLKKLAIALLVFFFIIVAEAAAQKNELTGILGRTFISDQVIQGSTATDNKLRFGDGLTFEVNYARRVFGAPLSSVVIEVPVMLNVDQDVHLVANPVSAGFKSYFVTPAVRANLFPGQAVSPWVSVGGGFGHFSQNTTPGFSTKGNTTGVFQIGGGLDVTLYRSFSLRGEVRDFWSGVPEMNIITDTSRQHNLFVGGGVVWHF